MNLDKLLKKIEINYNEAEKQEKHALVIGGESYEVLTMTRAEKSKFMYSYSMSTENKQKLGDMIEWARPFIYRSLQLAKLAERAKTAGYIKKYYDVIDMLFEPSEIMEIIAFLIEINKIGAGSVEENVEYIKKQ
jgi:hypothetical protein